MIERPEHARKIIELLADFPVVAIVGARQTGKTTLATRMVRVLPPWHENLGKRQVKAPKVYLADSGLLRALGVEWQDCYHWRLHTGAELDLLVSRGDRRLGFEIKRTDSPRLTRSMRSALDALRLDRLFVVHAGTGTWPLAERVEALPLGELFQRAAEFRRAAALLASKRSKIGYVRSQ